MFVIPASAHELEVFAFADGHRAEWRVTALELAGGFPRQESVGRVNPWAASASPMASGDATASAGSAGAGWWLDPTLEAAIERAVARQVRPLREELLAARDAIRFPDVLGAIGYIFGLTGLALWWRSRRPADRR